VITLATIKFKPLGFNSEEVEKRAKEIGAVKKNTATSSNTIAGVDSSTIDKAYKSTFKESDDVKNAMSESGTALGNVKDLTSKGQLVSDDTWNSLGKKFSTPNSVIQADSYLNSQLKKIQSGKTSYSDQVRDMMDTIMGREKFTYDVDKDPLFQQALASAMNSGKTAMQDTIGQASALTGGYGSSYATSAGNQAYNAFIEDAYNNLPQYYQMAMEAYQMEGDDLYRQLGMLTDADDREYSRNVTAYDATYQHRNQMYNEAYQQFRDAKNDAYNVANLKLSEHGQLVNDAYNYFNASADYANTLYEREYNKWADEVNQAMMWAQMLNSDWWKNTEFGEGVRQYEQNFAEQQRQYEKDYAQKDEHFNKNLEFTEAENQKDRDWKSSESQLDRQHQSNENALNRQHQASENQKDRNLTISENAKYKSGSGSDSPKSGYVIREDENGNKVEYKEATQTMMKDGLKAYNEGGTAGLKKYLASVPESYDIKAISDYAYQNGESWVEDYDEYSGWSISKDTYNGGFLGTPLWSGVDHNDTFIKEDTAYSYDDLAKKINASNMPDEKKKELLKSLQNQSKK
jgi:hypothetical protein